MGKKVRSRELDAALMKEWHPNKNGSLKPADVTHGSGKQVWWKCDRGHEWKARISDRTIHKAGCPYCSGKRLTAENSLAILRPDLANEWHPTKNDDFLPSDVGSGSRKKVWWICEKGHEWPAVVKERARACGSGCPYCAGNAVGPDNNLSVLFPQIAAEWHPTRNGSLMPSQVTPGSGKKVWWLCEYNHKWEAAINNRSRGRGCPYCSGVKAGHDNTIDIRNPRLASEWHPSKNGTLLPSDFTPGSGKMVWWLCRRHHEWQAQIAKRNAGSNCPVCSRRRADVEKNLAVARPDLILEWHPIKNGHDKPDDFTSKSNHRAWWKGPCGHEWKAQIGQRTNGAGCPYCTGQRVDPTRSLAKLRPDLAAEWHPTRNGDLQASDVLLGSARRVWWLCENGHDWDAVVNSRVKQSNCPYCSKKRVSADYNLEESFPELAAELDQTKNVGISPQDLLPGTHKRVWWRCARGHKWRATVKDRVNGSGCPKCTSKTSRLEIQLYCELKTVFRVVEWRERVGGIECDVLLPEHGSALELDGHYWHKSKEDQDRQKSIKLAAMGITVCRLREFGLEPLSDNDIVLEKSERPLSVVRKIMTKFKSLFDLSPEERFRLDGYLKANRLANGTEYRKILTFLPGPIFEKSLSRVHPDLARQWNRKKNDPLKPEMFSPGSNFVVWWLCEHGHEWRATIYSRAKGSGCPYCSGKYVCETNNLAVVMPDLASEWHPTKNGTRTPYDVTPGSHSRAWWKCPNGHEWRAQIKSRAVGRGCRHCAGKEATRNYNLAVLYPQLVGEWHPTKNGQKTPYNVLPASNKKAWWLCPKGHEYDAVINNRKNGSGCPYCTNKKVGIDNALAVMMPDLASEWHPTKNGTRTSADVVPGSHSKAWWKCPNGHEWEAQIKSRASGRGCPHCRRLKTKHTTASPKPEKGTHAVSDTTSR